MINSFADCCMAILVTTHYLEEAEQCNRLRTVSPELVAQETPSFKGGAEGTLLELVTDKPQLMNNLLKEQMERWRVSLFGDRLHVIVDEDAQTASKNLTDRLTVAGVSTSKARVKNRFHSRMSFIAVVEQMRKEGKTAEE